MGVAHGVITDNKAESLIDVIAMVSLVVLGSIAFAKFLSHHIAKVYPASTLLHYYWLAQIYLLYVQLLLTYLLVESRVTHKVFFQKMCLCL